MPRLAGGLEAGQVTGAAVTSAHTDPEVLTAPPVRTGQVARIGTRHGSPVDIGRMLDRSVPMLQSRGYRLGHHARWGDAAEAVFVHEAPWHRIVLSAVAAPPQPDDVSDPLFAELERHDVTVHVAEGAAALDPERFHEVTVLLRTACAPFTDAESTIVAGLNPLVERLVRDYRAQGTDLSRIHLVLREHLLLEKLNLLSGLRALGLRPDRTHVVRKRDSTRYWRRICAELQGWGAVVHPDADETDLPAVADAIERDVVLMGGGDPVIAVDDGADLLVRLLARRRAGGTGIFPIETTTKGMVVLRAAGLAGQVVDLASCTTKTALSRQIAVSCVQRFRELLQHEPLEGEWCHVVGYGRLGSHVAGLLRAIGMNVTVSDVSADARALARAAGYQVRTSAAEALREREHRYLFGCSGSPAVGVDEIALMTDRPVVCSLSSQDLRPLLAGLRPHGPRVRHGLGLTCTTGRQHVTVLGHGDAVNLFLAEGVPEPDFDSFTAMTLATVVEQAMTAEATGALLSPADVDLLSRRMEQPDD
jgi:S-adenosyl-L-homocysteine hydrolase, NAD binding domain